MTLDSVSCRRKRSYRLQNLLRMEKREKNLLTMIETFLTVEIHPKRSLEIGKRIVPITMLRPAIDQLQSNFISGTYHIQQLLLTCSIFSLVTMGGIIYWNVISLQNGLLASLEDLDLLPYRKTLPVRFWLLVESAR